jgi:hypothetical protein
MDTHVAGGNDTGRMCMLAHRIYGVKNDRKRRNKKREYEILSPYASKQQKQKGGPIPKKNVT